MIFSSFLKGFKEFGENLALIINSILLLFVYIFGVGLTSIISKLVGKHFLDYKKKDSYWISLDLSEKKIEDYYRQF